MRTTTATYNIRIEYISGIVEEFQRTLPTKPTTHKGIVAQNNRLIKWVDKYLAKDKHSIPKEYTITPLFS